MNAQLQKHTVTKRRLVTSNTVKVLTSCALLGMAAFFVYSHVQRENPSEPLAYFYDLSEGKLFVRPQSSIPPIEGLTKGQLDGVRAVVISTNGDCSDKKARGIAYLEKCSPQLKQQMEAVQKAGAAAGSLPLEIGRGEAGDHIFVRRLGEDKWYTRASPEGQKIMIEWQVEGPKMAAVCVP
jgi:hypothetical protein